MLYTTGTLRRVAVVVYIDSVSQAHVFFFRLRALRSSYHSDLNVIFDYSVNFSSTGSFTYVDVRTAKLLRISIEDAIPIFDFPLIGGKNH